jgi:The  BURPS668_1122 family of deaminases
LFPNPFGTLGIVKNKESNMEAYLDRINQIRETLGVSPYKNIAVADFLIGNDRGELIAISGLSTRSGTVGLPDNPLFQTFEVPPGHSRAYDSERKLLEELGLRYVQTPEVQGRVNLWTERAPCDSCCEVIEQFRRRFPNIILTVNDTM